VPDVVITYVGSDAGTITMTDLGGNLWALTAPDKLQSQSTFEIRDLGGALLQNVSLHTSCSKPLAVGDQFGSMKVVEMTLPDGTIIGGVIDPQEPQEECTVFNDRTECGRLQPDRELARPQQVRLRRFRSRWCRSVRDQVL
jgi:hypothetical protein